ncbi:unnamed protein product [Rotaria magnacalcarata]|uniref:NAD(P)(+)--arginine ADP-ribosyltransferase n=1 Tax=Rotaria magnacalcarata TaxID=392030 RepID=A0A815VKX8_9BILA|nr:unnamed protein product [Rotaria magnacalcarata]CAF4960975.1 unnamed protein product [Rotaria magnacalcarata]
MRQLHTIYIVCGNKERHEQWAKEWSKIEGVFISIQSVWESLKKVLRRCNHNAIPMSFVPKRIISVEASSDQQKLDQLEPIFIYSVLFKEIILEIADSDDTTSVKNLVTYGRQQKVPESQLNNFQKEYHNQSPIWWYTKDIFLFTILNRALREFNTEAVIKMSFFIRNLHRHLEKLQKEQLSEYKNPLIVYRGQGLTQQDFQHLLDIKDELLSFNIFLSTSEEQEVPMAFADIPPHLDNEIISLFANIQHDSAFKTKEEILFSMNTVFRVGDIKQSAQNNLVWEVQLTLTDDNDPQLADLIDYMKVKIDGTEWHRIGQLMLNVDHFYQAEILYNQLLSNASSDSDRSYIYHMLGWLKDDQGQFKDAASFYEQSLAIKQKSLKEDDPSLADAYNDLGVLYNSMGDYSKALEYYVKTFKIDKKTLPPNHPNLATSHNNIG